jgi:adenylyltransferase/sulfurtransferase
VSVTAGAGAAPPALSPEELQRYARHLALPHVGPEGQAKLKAARVLLVGVGGLGSPAGLYLAAAGVGTLGLIDHDVVEFSNLQRQIIHGTASVGRSKLDSAAARLADVNPGVAVVRHETLLSSANALDILAPYDVVVDGSDNFPTRYLVNDACVLLGKPHVYGSIFRFEGQAAVFWAARGPCYRCLYRDPPPPELVPSCAEGGVLGVLPGIVGSIQATEAIKLILGAGEPLIGRLLLCDALRMSFRALELAKDPDCPVCGTHPTVTRLIDYEAFCGAAPRVAEERPVSLEVTVGEVKAARDAGRPVALIDVRERWEWDLARIEGARLVPLATLPDELESLPRDGELILYCHSGPRSRNAALFLRGAGFANARSMAGGIKAWAREIDPAVPQY